jgi:hypothetical protein
MFFLQIDPPHHKIESSSGRINDFLHASHLPTLQSDFESGRMGRRFREDVFDNALRQFARALILFLDDEYGHPDLEAGSGMPGHCFHSFRKTVKSTSPGE